MPITVICRALFWANMAATFPVTNSLLFFNPKKHTTKSHITMINHHQVITHICQQVQCSGQVLCDGPLSSHPSSPPSSGHLPAMTDHLGKDNTAHTQITFGQCCFSFFGPKQWNLLSSDIHHIQSSRAFKIALTYLYKQYHKWFQIILTYLPYLPSLTPHYIPSVHMCVCLCVRMHTHVHARNTILWLYNWLFLTFQCIHFCWSCKEWCAHPCQWDTVL